MQNLFTTLLICILFLIIGCSSVPVSNGIGLSVPKGSIDTLLEQGKRIAKENKLKIKSIRFDTIYHPNDTAVAIVEFEERNLGNNVFEFSKQAFTNSNWPSRRNIKGLVATYPEKLGIASTKWVESGKIRRLQKLRISIDGEEVFVLFHKIDVETAENYLRRFIDWSKTHPNEFKDKLKVISSVDFDKNKEKVTFYFNRKLSGRGYVFDVSDGNFIFVGISHWVS